MSKQNVSIKMSMEGKNMILAYVLWWFLGFFGVHRFYLGRVKSGITQMFLSILSGFIILSPILISFQTGQILTIIGLLSLASVSFWWILDIYFTYKITSDENSKLGLESSSISLSKSGASDKELEQLEKLHSLFERGVITKEQYDRKKSLIMY